MKKGFTIIEALITVFLVTVITLAFYSAFVAGMNYILEVRNRLGAVALANEKMEIIRNLDYDNIGTKTPDGHGGYSYGIPAGDILEQETVVADAKTYYVFTFIQYVDDPTDGTFPTDTIPNDYKRVSIEVAWVNDITTSKSVKLVSNFIPQGVETSAPGGILSVNILNSQAKGIPQAEVHLYDPNTQVDVTALTDDSGNITWPGTPADGQNYSISVSKSGYYSIQTYPPYPGSAFKPVNENASVIINVLNTKVLITDQVSTVTIDSKDVFGNSIPNTTFNLSGGFKKGDTPATPSVPVYDFVQTNLTTGNQGEDVLSGMSYGNYSLNFNPISGYSFVEFNPPPSTAGTFNIPAGSQSKITAYWASQNLDSLLVQVVNNADGTVLSGASVELINSGLNYDVTLATDSSGYAYFPQSLPALSEVNYQLKVTDNGFQEADSTVLINKLTTQTVKLTAN